MRVRASLGFPAGEIYGVGRREVERVRSSSGSEANGSGVVVDGDGALVCVFLPLCCWWRPVWCEL